METLKFWRITIFWLVEIMRNEDRCDHCQKSCTTIRLGMTKISYFIPTSFDKNAGRNGNADQAFHRFPFLSYETDILMSE